MASTAVFDVVSRSKIAVHPCPLDETIQGLALIALGFLPDADLLTFACACRSFRTTAQAQNQHAAEAVEVPRNEYPQLGLLIEWELEALSSRPTLCASC